MIVVATHYGDPFWINNLIHHLDKEQLVSKVLLGHIYSEEELNRGVTAKLPEDLPQKFHTFEILIEKDDGFASDRHAKILKFLLQQHMENFKKPDRDEIIVILDSDMILISEIWVHELLKLIENHDALMSISHAYSHAAHSCLMVFRERVVPNVDFECRIIWIQIDGTLDNMRSETGSRLPFHLNSLGYKVAMTRPVPYLHGRFGYTYLNGSILHLGGQSVKHVLNRRQDIKISFHEQLAKFIAKKYSYSGNLPKSYVHLLVQFYTSINKNQLTRLVLQIFLRRVFKITKKS